MGPPHPILKYSPKPSSNILPNPALVLGLITLCTPNKTSWPAQVQTLKTKLHFLFISKIHPLNPQNPFLYFLFFSFLLSSLIHFHLHWYHCLPTNPKTLVLCTHSPEKKNPDQFFLSSSALVLELGDWWVFFPFLSIRHLSLFSIFFWFSQLSTPKYSHALYIFIDF